MNNPLSTIRTALKNKLDTLLADKVKVYDYFNSNPEQYPCLLFDLSSRADDFLTNISNIATINFRLSLIVDEADEGNPNGFTEQEATYKLDELMDIIVKELEKDYNLGGVVDYCTPTVSNREAITTPKGLGRAQHLNLIIKQQINTLL